MDAEMLAQWLQVLGPTILVVIGGLVTWLVQNKIEKLKAAQERLHSERRKIYAEVLDPYIRLFSAVKTGQDAGDIIKTVGSYEYRKAAFELTLVGSDDVVKAFGDMMQFSFRGEKDAQKMMLLWGKLLLEIRKSLGNENTDLGPVDMLRFAITDIDRLAEKKG